MLKESPWSVALSVIQLSSVAMVLTLAVGCTATVSMAPEAEDQAAKEFVPAAGTANLYVARKDSFVGSALAFEVKLDGDSVGSVATGTFVLIEMQQGQHIVSCHTSENQDIEKLTAISGENYFMELTPKMGMMSGRCELNKLDSETGRQLVLAGSMAEDLQIED